MDRPTWKSVPPLHFASVLPDEIPPKNGNPAGCSVFAGLPLDRLVHLDSTGRLLLRRHQLPNSSWRGELSLPTWIEQRSMMISRPVGWHRGRGSAEFPQLCQSSSAVVSTMHTVSRSNAFVECLGVERSPALAIGACRFHGLNYVVTDRPPVWTSIVKFRIQSDSSIS